MKREIKLIITDFDGTIADKNNQISAKTRETFERLKQHGVKIIVATGRMFPSAEIMAKRLNLDSPIVAYQGATIQFSGEDKPIFANYLDKTYAQKIVKYLKEKNIHTQIYINDEIIVENDNDIVKAYAEKMELGYKVVKNLEEEDLSVLPKILAINMNPDIVSNLQKETQKMYGDKVCITLSTPYFCEFTNPKAHKGEALKFLADYYNIPLEKTMAFGDQNNDITMIQNAGIGVAVGNASENLKRVCDFVTKSIDEDGVAYAIEKFVDFGVENAKV